MRTRALSLTGALLLVFAGVARAQQEQTVAAAATPAAAQAPIPSTTSSFVPNIGNIDFGFRTDNVTGDAARYSRFLIRSSLQPVRTRQTFKRLFGKQDELGGRLEVIRGDLGRRARGTPLEGWWGSNREDRAREAARAEAAASQAEAERAAAAEWDRAVAANRAERERFAREAAERWANRKQKGA